MARERHPTHDLVVVQQDNGELQEDITPRTDGDDARLDQELEGTFPASDPSSHWSGDAPEGEPSRRVVHRQPLRPAGDRTPDDAGPGSVSSEQIGGLDGRR